MPLFGDCAGRARARALGWRRWLLFVGGGAGACAAVWPKVGDAWAARRAAAREDAHDAPRSSCSDLRKSFGRTEIIRGVSLDIAPGERHAIIGPNGAGKSTLFNLISGRIAPSRPARSRSRPAHHGPASPTRSTGAACRAASRSPTSSRICRSSRTCAARVLWSLGYRYSFWRGSTGLRDVDERAARLLELIGLAARRDAPAGVLTYAEQRALEIGITIAGGADVILLDEPTAGMSHAETERAVALIRRVTEGRDAADGRARHERGVRPRRPHFGAGLRPDHRLRHAGRNPRRHGGAGRPISARRRTHDLLEVEDLHAYYGKSHILQGVDFHVDAGEIVSLLGRNGVGRSTTVKAIMGEVRAEGLDPVQGRARSPACKPHQIARLGLGYVPENRDIFPGLTVRAEPDARRQKPAQADRALGDGRHVRASFPRLSERADTPAGVLSGGEQQMLTICRTLMGDPDLVMIDEPTEGLAPMTAKVGELIAEIARRGVAVLLVEQKLTIAMRIPPRLRDGPRPHRVRGHAGRTQGECGSTQGMAGGLTSLRRAACIAAQAATSARRPAWSRGQTNLKSTPGAALSCDVETPMSVNASPCASVMSALPAVLLWVSSVSSSIRS